MFKPERTMELNEEIRLRSALRLSGVSVKDDDVCSRSAAGIYAFENWIAAEHISGSPYFLSGDAGLRAILEEFVGAK